MPYKDKEKERKRCRIKRWRSWGVKGDLELIHDKFMKTKYCEICKCDFDTIQKMMDHNHETGEFRNILCNKCNTNLLDTKKRTTNKSGHKNIRWCKTNNLWVYQKTIYGKTITRSFKSKIDCLCFKLIYLLKVRASAKKKK